MKRLFFINLALFLIVALTVGCKTTQSFKQSISSSFDSMTSEVDQKLYAQVPEDKRKGIPEAEFDLELNKSKEALATLKKERSINELKIVGYDLDIASKHRKKAAAALDLKKMDAINSAGLGEKEKNIKTIADLKAKVLNIDADIVKIQAKQDNLKGVINDLNKQIEEQEKKVKGMKKDQ
jgi:chromosome segregation ATPase